MLKSLHIRNYAIIDEVKIDFGHGLSIITGETGAGKSILLGALGLVMGKRADTSVLFSDKTKCYVEVNYDISAYNLTTFFAENELDYDDECIIRREISPSGKSRAFINDSPVNLSLLKELSIQLVDLHQQFDQLDINEEHSQISALDAVSGNVGLINTFSKGYQKFRDLYHRIEGLKSEILKNAQEEDYLKFQLGEFEELQLQPDELKSLESELNKLSNSEEIKRIGFLIESALSSSESSILDSVDELIREIRSIADMDDSANALRENLMNIREEISDISKTAYGMADDVEYDPERISEIEERLNIINRLLNKYNVQSSQELMDIEKVLIQKYDSFSKMDQDLESLENELNELRTSLVEQASIISQNRIRGGETMQKKINAILHDLSMKNAQLKVEIKPEQKLRETGTDAVSFLFSANKGSTFLPLSKVASGGELSRINLALKSTIAGALTLPTLIFDEIDSGVSGQVALMMGKILKSLSLNHQTICITHSPQIAAQADTHFKIYKTDKESRTFTYIMRLNQDDRKIEIAKMLSGDPPSDEAINNAKQLLQVS